jgi:hypothetical protein
MNRTSALAAAPRVNPAGYAHVNTDSKARPLARLASLDPAPRNLFESSQLHERGRFAPG